MATDDRKQRILQHLKLSTEGMLYTSSQKSTQPSATPTPPTPVPQPIEISPSITRDERKRWIMTHVKNSSGEFGDFSLSSEQRKKQIEDHIRKSIN